VHPQLHLLVALTTHAAGYPHSTCAVSAVTPHGYVRILPWFTPGLT